MTNGVAGEAPANGSLKDASVNRLVCLFRHWTWADEALARFERELANGWEYDEDPIADHPFGAYYQWCTLLCGLTEAAPRHRHRGDSRRGGRSIRSRRFSDVATPDLRLATLGATDSNPERMFPTLTLAVAARPAGPASLRSETCGAATSRGSRPLSGEGRLRSSSFIKCFISEGPLWPLESACISTPLPV